MDFWVTLGKCFPSLSLSFPVLGISLEEWLSREVYELHSELPSCEPCRFF